MTERADAYAACGECVGVCDRCSMCVWMDEMHARNWGFTKPTPGAHDKLARSNRRRRDAKRVSRDRVR